MKIKVNKYTLTNPNIINNKTILNMSDVHGNINALNSIINYLKTVKIDYILIPGDIIDSHNQKKQNIFLDKIIELTKYAKVYMCLGNHDVLIKKGKEYIEINDYNKYLFFNKLSSVNNLKLFTDSFNFFNIDNNISLTTVVLPNIYYSKKESKKIFDDFIKKEKISKKIDSNKLNIMLCHSPNQLANKNKLITTYDLFNKMNLILCGHNHGGLLLTNLQDLINNHYGLVGPYKKIIQKNAYGIFNGNNRSLLISNGVTKMSTSSPLKLIHGIGNRILMPEIDLIYIKNGKNNVLKLDNRKVYKI